MSNLYVKYLQSVGIKDELIKEVGLGVSSKFIEDHVPGINTMVYNDMIDYGTVDDLLGPIGACAILYSTSPSYGHWTLLRKVDDDTLEFFDSYGDDVDHELDEIPYDNVKREEDLLQQEEGFKR